MLANDSPEILNLCEKYKTIELGNEAVDGVKSDCFNMLRDLMITEGLHVFNTFEYAYKNTVNHSLPGAYRSAKSVLSKAHRQWQSHPDGFLTLEDFLKDENGVFLGKTALGKKLKPTVQVIATQQTAAPWDIALQLVRDMPIATDMTDSERRVINQELFKRGYNTSYVP